MARGRKKYIAPAITQLKTVKKPEYRTIDVYTGGHSVGELQEIRRVLAKQANQRILRLERAKSSITDESYNTFGAVIDVYDYLENKGRRRFSESKAAIKQSNELRREITVLQGFLGRKSSTVKGMREIENARLRTFSNKGIKFASTREFYEFLTSQTFLGLVSSGFTSEQIVESYDITREKEDDKKVVEKMAKALDEFRQGEKKVSIKNLEQTLGIKLLSRR